MGWIVPKAVTIFPFIVFGFDLTSSSALRITVDCRMTYTLAMIYVVSYLPRVLWSTTILTIERVDSRRTFFFIRVVAMPSVAVWIRRMSGITIIRVSIMFRRAIVRIGVESATWATIGWIIPIEAGTILPFPVLGFDLKILISSVYDCGLQVLTPLQW